MLPKLSLILGGASSGKTAFAEGLVKAAARRAGHPPLYIATAQPGDGEIAARIARHKAARGSGWTTREEPLAVASALAGLHKGQGVLVDCATLWLSNQMLAGADLADETETLLQALRSTPARVVVVSNEVGHGIVPDNALARRFRDAQGRLNQALAGAADLAVLVVAGLPLVLKGSLPKTGSKA